MRGRRARWLAAMMAASLCILMASVLEAQEGGPSTQWEMTIGAGVEEVASRDEAGSPLAYTGVGFPLVVGVDARGQRWSGGGQAGVFSFGVNGGRLAADMAEPGNPSHRADSVFVDLSAWLDREVLRLGNHRLTLGGQLGHWTFFRSYLYNPAQIGSLETWEATISADARMGIDGQFGVLSWGLGASAPLVGWVMRPSYAVRGDERVQLVDSRARVLTYGKLTTVHRLQMIQAEAHLGVQLGRHWGLRAQYRVGRLSYTNQLQTRAFAQRGTLGLSFRF